MLFDELPELVVTTSRVYSDVCVNKPPSYFEYDSYSPQIEDIEQYSLIKKIGQGKYSLVFEALDTKNKNVVVKILKPIKKLKVKRELKILDMVKNGMNTVTLLGAAEIPGSLSSALVFEGAKTEDFKDIYLKLNVAEIRFYTSEILKALDFCHSKGIMHRDVKPHNLIVDRKSRSLKLIDFGLAEFYKPGERYNVRVASRHYKGPELLVDYGYYDYSLDLWSLGCVFAAMIFHKEPFFPGSDNHNQLYTIVRVLGASKFYSYLKKYSICIDTDLQEIIGSPGRKPWEKFITSENEHFVNKFALDFLESLLCFDHLERLSAKEALNHKYFKFGTGAIDKPKMSV